MLTYFLFLFYLIGGITVLHWAARRHGIPFTIYHTTAAVLFKVSMGILYGYIFFHYYGGDDTWEYFTKSKTATDILLTHPGNFVKEMLLAFHCRLLIPTDGAPYCSMCIISNSGLW